MVKLKRTEKMLDTTQADPKPVTKHRHWATVEQYEEALNLVRNTLKIEEGEALQRAGYSGSGNSSKWRRDGRVPLLAVNALKGLVVGREIEKLEDDKQPLKLSTADIETLLHALMNVEDVKAVRRLRAGLHKEIARRLEQ